jgi:hypothetical protein
MLYPEGSVFIGLLGIIQIAGLASAWLTRMAEGSCWGRCCQRLFLVCLGAIGTATMVTVVVGARHWLSPATTLCIMVLAAIWDFRGHVPHNRHEHQAVSNHPYLA